MCLFPDEGSYWAEKLWTDINLHPGMYDKDKKLCSIFSFGLRKWWLHVQTNIEAHLWLHSLQIFWSANMPQNVFLNNCSCPVFWKVTIKKDTFVLDNLWESHWITLAIHFAYLKNLIKLICEVTKKFKSILKEKEICCLLTTMKNTCMVSR